MNVRLVGLDLSFRHASVEIPFSSQLTFIHGQTGAGKSSIARLVDWCLGGDMAYTPALNDELVAAALFLEVSDYGVRIARDREDKGHVRLSWLAEGDDPRNEVVPLQSQGGDWDPSQPETLSDHLFVLAGITPLRVPQSRKREDARLQRLSFRDFLAFCYLPQEKLDVALFRFGEIKARKSEDVMRALLGLFSEEQQRLQNESDSLLRSSQSLTRQADEVTSFLDRLQIDDLAAVERNLADASERVKSIEAEQHLSEEEQLAAPHPNDQARQRSLELEGAIDNQRRSLVDIAERLERDRRLRAELITAQLKIERSTVAVEILAGVKFGHCPQCGNTVTPSESTDACGLCHQEVSGAQTFLPAEASETDLQSRIDELANSIERHQQAQSRERRRLRDLEQQKAEEDAALAERLRAGESKRLSGVRERARRLTVARNEYSRYESASRLRSEVLRLRKEGAEMEVERADVVERLKTENAALEEREQTRAQIAAAFKEALLAVSMPDITEGDQVVIGDDLQPKVEPASGASAYGFRNLGSSGMKTLFQCCYALALHRVAAEHDLILPRFLIIDTPTQNIDERVDGEIFHGFFRYLYEMMAGPMRDVQVILIDSELEAPPDSIDLTSRKMLRNDPDYPRLVPYGPTAQGSSWGDE